MAKKHGKYGKIYSTNNSRRMAGVPLRRKKNPGRRYLSRIQRVETLDAFVNYCATAQHAYDAIAHMFLLIAYGWSHYPKSIYDELEWVPILLANDEADENFLAALQQAIRQDRYPGPQCQFPIVRDNLCKHYDISQEEADRVAEILRNMQRQNINITEK